MHCWLPTTEQHVVSVKVSTPFMTTPQLHGVCLCSALHPACSCSQPGCWWYGHLVTQRTSCKLDRPLPLSDHASMALAPMPSCLASHKKQQPVSLHHCRVALTALYLRAALSTACRSESCKMDPRSRTTWGLCESQQRPALLDLAAGLHNGSMLHFHPCDLYQLIKGRTLWLVGWVAVSTPAAARAVMLGALHGGSVDHQLWLVCVLC